MTDRQTDLFIQLQSALEATKGFVRWSDVALGIERAMERKRQEAINGLLSNFSLIDLQLAEQVAHREMGFHAAKASKPASIEVITRAPEIQSKSVNKPRRNRRA